MVLIKLLERSIGIISTIVLARILVPEDFGLNAMSTSVIALIALMRAFNFDVFLIQKQTSERSYYDTAWSYNVCMGLASAVLLTLLAPHAANFFSDERLVSVLYVLAIGAFVTSLQNIGVVDFRKNLEFHKEFTFILTRKLVGFIVAMLIAFTYKSYWALILGTLASHLTGLIMSYIIHPYRPSLCFKATKELFGFSSWLQINNLLFFTKLRSADFVIGRQLGGHELGVFSIAYEISNMSTTELIAPINRAVFPGYSKMKNIDELRQGFIDVIALIICIALPVGAGLSATAPLFVPLALGSNWIEIIPVIQILAFFGVVNAMQSNLGHALLAVGLPKLLTMLAAIYVALLIPTLIFQATNNGIVGAAWAYLGVSLITMPLNYSVIMRVLKIEIQSLINVLWRPLLSTIVMYALVHSSVMYYSYKPNFLSNVLGLIISIALGIVAYIACLFVLWIMSKRPAGAEMVILKLLKNRLFAIRPDAQ